jgi:HSP20 family molecular chaperone IbpA
VDPASQHRIEIRRVASIEAEEDTSERGAPANLYRSANYVVLDMGLPRCLPQHVRVTLAPGVLLVESERHLGTEPTEEGREYLLHELPAGTVRRSFPLPAADLALHEADAHFSNGMLTVSIPTNARDDFRRRVRGEA